MTRGALVFQLDGMRKNESKANHTTVSGKIVRGRN